VASSASLIRGSQEKYNMPELILSVFERQAATHLASGRLLAAERAARHALNATASATPASSLPYTILAQVHYEWNQLDTAERWAGAGVAASSCPDDAIPATVVLARVLAARGRPQEGLSLLDAATTRDLTHQNQAVLAAWRVRLWLAPGQDHSHQIELAAWIREQRRRHRWDRRTHPTAVTDLTALALARARLALGQPEAALRPVLEVRARAHHAGHVGNLVEVNLLEALTRQQLHQRTLAYAAVWQALALAEPERRVRTFADEGPAVARLLRRVPTHEPAAASPGPSAAYVQILLHACNPGSGSMPGLGTRFLTARERDVLDGLALGESNREIAGRLGLAVGTVNRHVHRVLEKLASPDRSGAVTAARRSGLL